VGLKPLEFSYSNTSQSRREKRKPVVNQLKIYSYIVIYGFLYLKSKSGKLGYGLSETPI
jgi:hypothetical protein